MDGVRRFVARALEVFGADRLMYGGDWPICVLSGSYQRVWEGLSEILDELDPEERRQILGGTAESFYGIDARVLRAARAASKIDTGGGLPA